MMGVPEGRLLMHLLPALVCLTMMISLLIVLCQQGGALLLNTVFSEKSFSSQD